MYKIITDNPHPLYSKDYTVPKGASHDNTVSHSFVYAINKNFPGKINYLDLGCAGGGLVLQLHQNGHNSFGIDGSDSQKNRKMNAWGVIPEKLFNADIAAPFELVDDKNETVKFDLISAWDVMEHIYEDKLEVMCQNIIKHLKDDGFFVCGIATFEDEGYHVTLHDKKWWIDFFDKNGLQFVADEFEEVARSTSFHLKLKKKV